MLTSTLSTFAASALVVATAAPHVFADLIITTMFLMFMGVAFRFGTDRTIVGEVHAAQVEHGQLGGRARGAGLISGACALAFLSALLFVLGPLAALLEQATTSPLTGRERSLLAVWLLADVVRLTVAEAHRADRRFRLAAGCSYGLRQPLFLVLLSAAWAMPGPMDRPRVFAAAALASCLVLIFAVVTVSQRYPWWRHSPLTAIRRSTRGNAAMVVTTMTGALIGSSDVWIVGATADAETSARYAFCVTLAAGIATLSTAISGGLSPYLAKALAQGNAERVLGQVRRYVRVAAVLALAMYVALILLAEPMAVHLGGESYRGLTPLLVLLAAGQVCSTAAGMSGYVLVLARRYAAVAAGTGIVAFLAVAGEAIVGFGWGSVLGVAAVSGLATCALPVANNIMTARILGIRTDVLSTPRGRP